MIAFVKRIARRCLHRAASAILRARSRPLDAARSDAVTLILAPHSDDETLGCGGLIALRRSLDLPVYIAYLTDSSGSHPLHPTLTPTALSSLRADEARDAMRTLGVPPDNLYFIDAPDGRLPHLSAAESSTVVTRLSDIISVTAPNEIFLPHHADGSTEHEAAFSLVARALAAQPSSPRVFEFPIWARWDPRRLFRPALTARRVHRLPPGAHTAAKQRALACYHSQIAPTPPWPVPALSPAFLDCFASSPEYFLET